MEEKKIVSSNILKHKAKRIKNKEINKRGREDIVLYFKEIEER